MLVSDLWQVGGFHWVLLFPPPIKPPQYNWNIVESGIKHHKPNLYCYNNNRSTIQIKQWQWHNFHCEERIVLEREGIVLHHTKIPEGKQYFMQTYLITIHVFHIRDCLPFVSTWVHHQFFGGVCVAHRFSFLCCPIMCLYVLSSMLCCTLPFLHGNNVCILFTSCL